MSKYRSRLTPAEEGMYDLMLKSSEILRDLAAEGVKDLSAALHQGDAHLEQEKAATRIEHDVVTYAFTLGVQFAVNRQQEVARQVAQKLGLVEEPKKN